MKPDWVTVKISDQGGNLEMTVESHLVEYAIVMAITIFLLAAVIFIIQHQKSKIL